MSVHNHSPYRPACNERIVGACMVTIDPADIPHLSEFAEDPRLALHMIADGVSEVGGGDLDATENLVRWLAEQMPPPPKPAEPTGLGAVVEVHGRRWVYTGDRDAGGQWWYSGSSVGRWNEFDSAVTLADGWQS